MAQTKTGGSKSKRTSGRTSSNGSRAKSASRSGSTKSRANGKAAASSRSSARKTKSSARKTTSSARKTASSARKTASSARKRAGNGSGSQGSTSAVGKAAQRAKGPAIAGGAALIGLAGGLALNNGKQRKGLAKARPKLNFSMPKPKGSTVKILGGAAKEIAKGGYKIGQLTSEVQKVRKAVEAQD